MPVPHAARRDIASLTGLRGVAAILVMLFHLRPFNGPPATAWQRLIGHGYLAVDLFFVLSGFVMCMTYRHDFERSWSWRACASFCLRRVARIYPLYLVATLLCLGLSATRLPGVTPARFIGLNSILENAVLIQAWGLNVSFDVPAWSISTEWAAYLMFPVLLSLAWSGPRLRSALVGIGALTLITGLAAAPWPQCHWRQGPLDLTEVGSLIPLYRCLAAFCLGIVSFRVSLNARVRGFFRRPFTTALVGLAVLGALTLKGRDPAIVALFPVLIVALSVERSYLAKFLALAPIHGAGLISYSIYLLHEPVADMLAPILANQAMAVRLAIIYAAVLAVSVAAYLAVERPGRQLIAAFSRRLAARPLAAPSP